MTLCATTSAWKHKKSMQSATKWVETLRPKQWAIKWVETLRHKQLPIKWVETLRPKQWATKWVETLRPKQWAIKGVETLRPKQWATKWVETLHQTGLFYVLIASKGGNIAFPPPSRPCNVVPMFKVPIENNKHPNFKWRGQGRGVDSFLLWGYPIWVPCLNNFVADCGDEVGEKSLFLPQQYFLSPP